MQRKAKECEEMELFSADASGDDVLCVKAEIKTRWREWFYLSASAREFRQFGFRVQPQSLNMF